VGGLVAVAGISYPSRGSTRGVWMSPARTLLEGPFSRSVREALESVVSSDVAEDVIGSALAIAGRATIPEDAPPFAAFYEGPLRAIVSARLGQGALDIVDERLAHVLRMAQSQVRPCETMAPPQLHAASPQERAADEGVLPGAPPGHETTPWSTELWEEDSAVRVTPRGLEAASSPAPAPVVLALTLDPLLVADVQTRFPASRVLSISSMHALLAQLSTAHLRLTIVIDTVLPSIDVPTVASLATAIPDSALVVLWGMSERQKERLVALFPIARTWVAASAIGAVADRMR